MIVKAYRLIEDRVISVRFQGRVLSKTVRAGTEFELPAETDPGPGVELIQRRWCGDEQRRASA
jgi:hypothetical protein